MGMPITAKINDADATAADLNSVFDYFEQTEKKFSVFLATSEITLINEGKIKKVDYSDAMNEILEKAEQTKKETNGFFDIIANDGRYNPSGLVKGWAINNAAKILKERGFENFYINAGGDIQVQGTNELGQFWSVGIRNPFNRKEIVRILYIKDAGVATSGTAIRGQHIYNPHDRQKEIAEIVSLTVIGPNIYEADRFATAAFAMGKEGIKFIESLRGFEAYLIDKNRQATMTSCFAKYTKLPG